MGTNDVSFLSFSVKPQGESKTEDKDKVKADVLKKLESTPVTYGMSGNTPQISSAVDIPIGQSKPPVDRFSPEGLVGAIEGFDEVSDDADVKNAFATSKWNPLNWFSSVSNNNDNAGQVEKSGSGTYDLTDAGLPTLTQADLEAMDTTDAEIAKFLNNSEFSQTSQIQGAKANNEIISTEERASAMDEMAKIAKEHADLTKILSDPNVTDAQKADAQKKLNELSLKASKLFESTPTYKADKTDLNPEVQSQVDSLSAEDKTATQQYLQSSLGKGVDDEDEGFNNLSSAAQNAVTSMANDLKVKNPDLD